MKKTVIIPNTARVIVNLIRKTETSSGVLMPGQLKAGENLYIGKIIHPGKSHSQDGTTHFKKGQVVYYSEYSASKLENVGEDYQRAPDNWFVVAEDDIMAYEEEVEDDTAEVSAATEAGKPKT